jgi:hypothetical protein
LPTPTAKPLASPSPALRPAPASRPTPLAAPAASAKRVAVAALPVHEAIATPHSPSAAAPPTQTPAPAQSVGTATVDDPASSVVRSYLQALARGDRLTATSYLARGLPSETFMNPAAHIESIRSSALGPQQYRVTADVQTSTGEYYVTFTVEPGPSGLQITDHYAIKPQ